MRHHAPAAPLRALLRVLAVASLASVASVAAGCNDSISATTGGDMATAPADLVPLTCHGVFSNAVNGTVTACKLEMTEGTSDVAMWLKVTGYAPLGNQPQPSMIIFNLVAAPLFKAQKYTLDSFADETKMTIQNSANLAYFIAGRTVDMNTGKRTIVGNISLTLSAAPMAPNGLSSWTDTTAHGSLLADLPLDPNSPGTPGDSVHVAIDF